MSHGSISTLSGLLVHRTFRIRWSTARRRREHRPAKGWKRVSALPKCRWRAPITRRMITTGQALEAPHCGPDAVLGNHAAMPMIRPPRSIAERQIGATAAEGRGVFACHQLADETQVRAIRRMPRATALESLEPAGRRPVSCHPPNGGRSAKDEGVMSTRKADLRCAYSSATGEAMLRPGQAGFATG